MVLIVRVGPEIKPFSIFGRIPDIKIIRPDIRQFILIHLTKKSFRQIKHYFLNSCYYINKLVFRNNLYILKIGGRTVGHTYVHLDRVLHQTSESQTQECSNAGVIKRRSLKRRSVQTQEWVKRLSVQTSESSLLK